MLFSIEEIISLKLWLLRGLIAKYLLVMIFQELYVMISSKILNLYIFALENPQSAEYVHVYYSPTNFVYSFNSR